MLHDRDFGDARLKALEPGRWQTILPPWEVLRPLRHGDFDFLRGDFLLGGIIFIYAFFLFFYFFKNFKALGTFARQNSPRVFGLAHIAP